MLGPDDITIAITVFDRCRYVKQAIASALGQTVPAHKVLVVEDCGPNTTLQEDLKKYFGAQIEYHRNSQRRGLFGNLNTCIELCATPWLSILHDDDYLSAVFVEEMLRLHRKCPDSGFYFGSTMLVYDEGNPLYQWPSPAGAERWRPLTLHDFKLATPCPFPGQLLNIQYAQGVGGFRTTSQYCGDWEMWCKLVAGYGGACTRATVAFCREHPDPERASNRVLRAGKEYPLNYVQMKRAMHLLRQAGSFEKLDRIHYQALRPIATRSLLRVARNLSPRLLSYHRRLLLLSAARHPAYALFQIAARLLGTRFLRIASRGWNLLFPEGCALGYHQQGN